MDEVLIGNIEQLYEETKGGGCIYIRSKVGSIKSIQIP